MIISTCGATTARSILVTYLGTILRPGDLCLTLAAGDLTNLAAELGGEAER